MSIMFEPDNPELKRRPQNNFDESAFGQDSGYFAVNEAQPFESTKLDYRAEELSLCEAPDRPEQTLIGETSHFSDVANVIRGIREEISELKLEYSRDLRTEFARLRAQHQVQKTWWRKTPTTVLRKAVYRKVKVGEEVITRRITLGTVQRFRTFRRRRSDGSIETYSMLVDVPRRRIVTLRRPKFVKVYVRKAGLRKIVIRTPEKVQSTDWSAVKAEYLVYKGHRRDKLDASLAPLLSRKAEYERMLFRRRQQPKRMETYTTHGFIPLNKPIDRSDALQRVPVPQWVQDTTNSSESPYRAGIGASNKIRFVTVEPPQPGRESFDETIEYQSTLRPSGLGIRPRLKDEPPGSPIGKSEDADLVRQYKAHLSVPHDIDDSVTLPVTEAFELRPPLPKGKPKMVATPDRERDVQIEHLAALQVENLSGLKDKSFDLTRSILELKDLPKTFQEVVLLLTFLYRLAKFGASGFPERVNISMASLLKASRNIMVAVAGGYLAWRFAIQPTIQDCRTVMKNTLSYITDANRTLSQFIRLFKEDRTNILHIRAKRHLAGNRDWEYVVHVDDEGDEPVVHADVHMTQSVTLFHTEKSVSSDHIVCSATREPQIGTLEAGDILPPVEDDPNGSKIYVEQSSHVDGSGFPHTPQIDGIVWDESARRVTNAITIHPDGKGAETIASRVGAYLQTDTLQYDSEFQREAREAQKGVDTLACEVPWYAENRMTVIYFGRYMFEGALLYRGFLDESAGLPKLVKDLQSLADFVRTMDSRINTESVSATVGDGYGLLKNFTDDAFAHIDPTKGLDPWVAWELTPLSFVYDWFTTSQTIARICSEWKRWRDEPGPPSLEGVWGSKRTELMVGRPSLALVRCRASFWVTEWYSWQLTSGYTFRGVFPCERCNGGMDYSTTAVGCVPHKSRLSYELYFRRDSDVLMKRSGLYRAVRGEYQTEGWETFLPKVEYKVDMSKSLTLVALVAQFLFGKRQGAAGSDGQSGDWKFDPLSVVPYGGDLTPVH